LAWSQALDQRKSIGVLLEYAEDDAEGQSRLAAFIEALRGHGWEAKRNVHFEYRFAAGDSDRIRSFADELVKLKPHVLFGSGAPVTAALQAATRTTPIIFVQASDPVGAGLVSNLGRPGGNVTGFTNFEYGIVGKWLELLREAAPSVSRVMTIQMDCSPMVSTCSTFSEGLRLTLTESYVEKVRAICPSKRRRSSS
jgi:putative tryptophan/tyrosine transport system substrate-binding protein